MPSKTEKYLILARYFCYPYIFPTIFPRAAAGRSLHKRLRNLYCCQSVRVRRNGGFACRVEGLEWNVRYGSNGASSGNNDHLVVFSHHDFPPENVDLVRVYRIAGTTVYTDSWIVEKYRDQLA